MALNLKALIPLDHPEKFELPKKVQFNPTASNLDPNQHELEKRAEDRERLRRKAAKLVKNPKKKLDILASR